MTTQGPFSDYLHDLTVYANGWTVSTGLVRGPLVLRTPVAGNRGHRARRSISTTQVTASGQVQAACAEFNDELPIPTSGEKTDASCVTMFPCGVRHSWACAANDS